MGRALLVLETQADRQKAMHWITKAPEGTRVEFKASKRSLPQNDLMWALLTEFAQKFAHNGKKYDPSEWKCIFLHAFGREISFLPSLDGRTFLPIEMSSSDLSKQEMTDFIEFIIKEAAERGIILSNTNNSESGSSPSGPGTAESEPSSASAASDDSAPNRSSDAPLSERELLIKYASDVLPLAATNGTTIDTLKAVDKEWAADIRKMTDAGIQKANAIKESSRAIFNDPAKLDGIIEHYAEMLDTTVEEIGGTA